MNFVIADTFTDSLKKLTAKEQNIIKTTAFDLQVNPKNTGHNSHRVDRVKDRNFWTHYANDGLRIITHNTDASLLLCYAGHHDDAYAWAERRRIDVHPETGAAALVELREKVVEVVRHKIVEKAVAKPRPLAKYDVAALLKFGVPQDWVSDVLAADEDELLTLLDKFPGETAELLLGLASGEAPQAPDVPAKVADPFQHPDAQRRFRTIISREDLELALDFPWDKWMVFLHPEQRKFVERNYNGPARVSGSAGTGKSIVAIHRAAHLARQNPDARILLTTFSPVLANALKDKLRRLVGNEPKVMERIEVHAVNGIAGRLYKAQFGVPAKFVTHEALNALLQEASTTAASHKFSAAFIRAEWELVIAAWDLSTWEEYKTHSRLGRKSKLPEERRAVLWTLFERVRAALAAEGRMAVSTMFHKLTLKFTEGADSPYDFILVDEAQDMGLSQLRFFGALAGRKANGLFFAGDIAQRIFQPAFSWATAGVDIRGRSRTLKVNYRTSHQIRQQADRLLEPEISDAEGQKERRDTTVSVFNGPPPGIQLFESEDAEIKFVAAWLKGLLEDGIPAQEIGVFVRSDKEIPRAELAVQGSGATAEILDESVEVITDRISIGTMHFAKGLEFRAVVVMACDENVIPSEERIRSIGDPTDLQEAYETERHLLYVACTRAREMLLVSGLEPGSEFIADMTE